MKRIPLYLTYLLIFFLFTSVTGAVLKVLHLATSFSSLLVSSIPIFFAILLILVVLLARKLFIKTSEIEVEKQKKEIAKLQLNSIRSQLNPHFLFNALAGIQNLMNKNEIENANGYLSKFARLTRNVLDSKELISLV